MVPQPERKKVAGIGSRQTPRPVLEQMARIGRVYAKEGWILRSGGAPGADMAFERGFDLVGGEKQIFLPWRGFNGNRSPYFYAPPAAYKILDHLFPEAKQRSDAVRNLFARNMQQVFGPNLDDPSDLVICWMKKETPTGGTGWAVRAAMEFDIPVVNLLHEDHLVYEYL